MQVTCKARVVFDPELRTVGNNTVLSVRCVTNLHFKTEEDLKGFFFDFELWGPRGAYLSNALKKGDQVYVYGTLGKRQWEKDGEVREAWSVKDGGLELYFAPKTDGEAPF